MLRFSPQISTRTHWTEFERREIPSFVIAGSTSVHFFTPFGVVVLCGFFCVCVCVCVCVHQLSVIVCHWLSSFGFCAKPNAKLMLHPLVSSRHRHFGDIIEIVLSEISSLLGGKSDTRFLVHSWYTLFPRAPSVFFFEGTFPTQRHGG